MVINQMSAIFNICFKLFSIMISLPEMGVHSLLHGPEVIFN